MGKLAQGAQGNSRLNQGCRDLCEDMDVENAAVPFGVEGQGGNGAPVEAPRGNVPTEEVQDNIRKAIEGPLGMPFEWLAASGTVVPKFWL